MTNSQITSWCDNLWITCIWSHIWWSLRIWSSIYDHPYMIIHIWFDDIWFAHIWFTRIWFVDIWFDDIWFTHIWFARIWSHIWLSIYDLHVGHGPIRWYCFIKFFYHSKVMIFDENRSLEKKSPSAKKENRKTLRI